MRADFVSVGEVLIDVTAGEVVPGERRHASVRLGVGGSAANSALAAAETGATAAVVARIGDDVAGAVVRSTLEQRGIEALLALDAGAPTGVFLEAAGGIVADRGASARLSPADLPDRLDATALLVSGYTLRHADTRAAGAEALARATGPWRAVGGTAGPDGLAAAVGATALLANADEARELTGAEPQEALRILQARYRLVCVTLGPEGALAACDGIVERVPGEVLPGTTTGAGDAFAGGLLAALVRGLPLGAALAQAAAAAVAASRRRAAGATAAAPAPRRGVS